MWGRPPDLSDPGFRNIVGVCWEGGGFVRFISPDVSCGLLEPQMDVTRPLLEPQIGISERVVKIKKSKSDLFAVFFRK